MGIQWKPSLALGVPLLDEQHQELFARVNRLVAALEAHRDREELAALLTSLGDHVVRHFGAEERLMLETGYGDFLAHRQAHEAFRRDLERLARELVRFGPSPAVSVGLDHRVCSWLQDHVGRTDRAFGAFCCHRELRRAG